MENEEASSARPSIGFPLGLTLLILMLFCMSGLFICCLHWEKVRSFFRPLIRDDNGATQTNIDHLPQKTSPLRMIPKQNQGDSVLVSMPGDEVPKFVAIACPCKSPRVEKVAVIVQKI